MASQNIHTIPTGIHRKQLSNVIVIVLHFQICNVFLKQARASRRLARALFLRIDTVHECLYACLRVCVSIPEAINN